MPNIHPTAQVQSGAQLADDVEIGPYCIVGGEVLLHAGVRLVSHVIISNRTEIGAQSIVYPFTSLGAAGQIYQNKAETGRLKIGVRCEIREHVTMNCGSARGDFVTEIGDDCMFMVGTHIAHDCKVGRKTILANGAMAGGHVILGEQVFLGGLSAVHQFCTVGEHVIVGALSAVRGHVIPFGNTLNSTLLGLNIVGLQRRGFSDIDIKTMNRAYRDIFLGKGVMSERLQAAKARYADHVHVMRIVDFIEKADKKRPMTLSTKRSAA